MPIYEFFCPDNRKIYSFFARSLALAGKTPRCPDNPRYRMEKLLSQFAVIGRAKEPAADGAGGGPEDLDDGKMAAAMAAMEREFGNLGEGDPDPKQLGRMMRKMSDLTGEKLPPAMAEMIARMEQGEDPEKLEEEYGDAMDELGEGGGEGDEAGAGGGPEGSAVGRILRRVRRRITRDPKLYEMAEYVD